MGPGVNQPAAQLDGLSLNTKLVLRTIVRMEYAAREDVSAALRMNSDAVGAAVRFALVQGYLEEREGKLRVTWAWYRSITRMLQRQNLLGAG